MSTAFVSCCAQDKNERKRERGGLRHREPAFRNDSQAAETGRRKPHQATLKGVSSRPSTFAIEIHDPRITFFIHLQHEVFKDDNLPADETSPKQTANDGSPKLGRTINNGPIYTQISTVAAGILLAKCLDVEASQ